MVDDINKHETEPISLTKAADEIIAEMKTELSRQTEELETGTPSPDAPIETHLEHAQQSARVARASASLVRMVKGRYSKP